MHRNQTQFLYAASYNAKFLEIQYKIRYKILQSVENRLFIIKNFQSIFLNALEWPLKVIYGDKSVLI